MASRCEVDIDAVLRGHERQVEIITETHIVSRCGGVRFLISTAFLRGPITQRPIAVAVGRKHIVGAGGRRLNIDPGDWLAVIQRPGKSDQVDMHKTPNLMAGHAMLFLTEKRSLHRLCRGVVKRS